MCSALRKRQCSSKSASSGKLEDQVQMWSPSARSGRSLISDLRATNRLPMPPERLFKPRSINGVPSRRSKRFPSATNNLPAKTKLTWHPQATTIFKLHPMRLEAIPLRKYMKICNTSRTWLRESLENPQLDIRFARKSRSTERTTQLLLEAVSLSVYLLSFACNEWRFERAIQKRPNTVRCLAVKSTLLGTRHPRKEKEAALQNIIGEPACLWGKISLCHTTVGDTKN